MGVLGLAASGAWATYLDVSADGERLSATMNSPDDIVIVSEDNATVANRGCDAVSIHSVSSGRAIQRGHGFVSPGRIGANLELQIIAATPSNGIGTNDASGDTLNPRGEPWLLLGWPHDALATISSGLALGPGFATLGGLTIDESERLIVATARYVEGPYGMPIAVPPFHVARMDVPSVARQRTVMTGAHEEADVVGFPFEVFSAPGRGEIIAVTSDGAVFTFDDVAFRQVGAPIHFPRAISARHSVYRIQPSIIALHATLDRSNHRLYMNRIEANNVSVVDLTARTSYTMTAGTDVSFIGGISYNNGWANAGLIAIRTELDVRVLQHVGDDSLLELSRAVVPSPRNAGGISSAITGPLYSLEWSASGEYIITASDRGPAEFAVLRVSDEGRTLELAHWLTACTESLNFPNDIWTANGLITPTAPPSPTPSLTTIPSATPPPTYTPIPPTSTPTPTDTPPPTDTPTASPTPPPSPIYLPLALTERCDPTRVRADVALVLDASSSMTGDKLAAAKAAAIAFIRAMRLPDDRVGIAAFDRTARLVHALSGDADALVTAIESVEPAEGTRIDRGLQAGLDVLAGARTGADVTPVLVLLTDGRQEAEPERPAEVAAGARGARIELHVVGLGSDVDAEALLEIAGAAERLHLSPGAAELEAIYTAVARSIPCPAAAFWGRR